MFPENLDSREILLLRNPAIQHCITDEKCVHTHPVNYAQAARAILIPAHSHADMQGRGKNSACEES